MKKRILFVDDDQNILDGLQRMLRQMRDEWDMTFVDSGARALEVMASQPFDVIVSDMRMPNMNGAELLTETLHRFPSIVRLVLSGHADRELVAQAVGVAHQYISKPCDPEQLKSLIRNACLLGGDMVVEEVKRILGSIDHLPSVPSLLRQLRNELEDENSSAQNLGDIIQQDMGMTAKILQLVNSAFFGLRHTISTPREAVTYLGIDTIKTLVVANSIFEQSGKLKTKHLHIEELWGHGMVVANAAKAIVRVEGGSKAAQEEAFVSGILHDVGILLLASNFPESYDRACEIVMHEPVSIPTAEQEEFGVTHAEVGAYLLGLWGIPSPILSAVSLHHRPGHAKELGMTSVMAVHVADVLLSHRGGNSILGSLHLDEIALARSGFGGRIDVWRAALAESAAD
jgi:HD-like signal output (HDOD) protein